MIKIIARIPDELARTKTCSFQSKENKHINAEDLKRINSFVIDALNNGKVPQISWKVTYDNINRHNIISGVSSKFNVISHQKWERLFGSLIDSVNRNIR